MLVVMTGCAITGCIAIIGAGPPQQVTPPVTIVPAAGITTLLSTTPPATTTGAPVTAGAAEDVSLGIGVGTLLDGRGEGTAVLGAAVGGMTVPGEVMTVP